MNLVHAHAVVTYSFFLSPAWVYTSIWCKNLEAQYFHGLHGLGKTMKFLTTKN